MMGSFPRIKKYFLSQGDWENQISQGISWRVPSLAAKGASKLGARGTFLPIDEPVPLVRSLPPHPGPLPRGEGEPRASPPPTCGSSLFREPDYESPSPLGRRPG